MEPYESEQGCITRDFERPEFMQLFRRAIDACRGNAPNHCSNSLPSGELFYVEEARYPYDEEHNVIWLPREHLLDFESTVDLLLRPDGYHRPDIRVSPFGIFGDSTVFEIEWDGDWTNRLIVGELSFPYEPFLLRGPGLDHHLPPDFDFRGNDPIPRIPLPTIRILPNGAES